MEETDDGIARNRMSGPPAAVTVAVVLGTFGLLFVRRVRRYPLTRAVTSATGAVVVVAIGAISPAEALAAVNIGTILLLFGMLAHVEALTLSGVYEWAAARLVCHTGSVRWLTLGTLGLAAAFSAIALNDAVVLLMTPVLVTAIEETDTDPVAPLLAVILGANIGSLATPLGNPQNAYILSQSHLTAGAFVARLAPVSLVSLAVAAVVLLPTTPRNSSLTPIEIPDLDRSWSLASGGFLSATLALLVFLPGVEPGVVAASMGIVHIAWLQLFRRVPGNEVLQSIDWSILVLFVGMFVLIGSLEGTGLIATLGRVDVGWPLAGVTFVLSNLVSNVPAVLVLSRTISESAGWFLLAAVSTLAGNATPVASAATLIVLDQAARQGVSISVGRILLIGMPVAVCTCLVAVAML